VIRLRQSVGSATVHACWITLSAVTAGDCWGLARLDTMVIGLKSFAYSCQLCTPMVHLTAVEPSDGTFG
jgi:hypothetical protein